MFDRTFTMKDQRFSSVSCHIHPHTTDGFRSRRINLDIRVSMFLKNIFFLIQAIFTDMPCFHSSVWESLLFAIMAELAFYPAVALMYFFGVMRATQDDRVELNDGASMNVFCLFVVAQPLCLVIGGYTGMATYLLTALVSYNFLPWRNSKQAEEKKASKKKK